MSAKKRIVLLTGEASGDDLGAPLMRSLRQAAPAESLSFYGIPGAQMLKQGCRPFFTADQLGIMGLTEVLPHLPRLLHLINSTCQQIIDLKPDLVVTIDAPAFNKQIIKRLAKTRQKGQLKAKFVHYVAPSVWAWRAHRAKSYAALFDHLLALLPIEPPYFEKEGLPTTFVGHPLLDDWPHPHTPPKATGALRKDFDLPPEAMCIAVLPGSRRQEVERHLPIFLDTLGRLRDQHAALYACVITLPHLEPLVRQHTDLAPMRCVVSSDQSKKYSYLADCRAGLAASGTVSLELALVGLPSLIAYKVSPLSYALAKRMIKVPYASLLNILEDKPIFPEYLQNNCTADLLAPSLAACLDNDEWQASFQQEASQALAHLRANPPATASDIAAKALLSL